MTPTAIDKLMMRRCLHLAAKGSYHVKTNPQVGAVITYRDKIIGEGYHKKFGGPHAEIEALDSIRRGDRSLLSHSHMYISLEPCHHHGKTPPCVGAILQARIPKVTICNSDPNPKTHQKSILKLRAHGVEVSVGLLAAEGVALNKAFFVQQSQQLPYIVLKWAQSKDGYIGKKDEQVWLSNAQSKLLVHRWREELDAILVGTNTVLTDDPMLTNRRGSGRSPLRVILDKSMRIPASAKVLSDRHSTLIFTQSEDYYQLDPNKEIQILSEPQWPLASIMASLYSRGIGSVMVEGGAQLLKSMINEGLWHEARVIHTTSVIGTGVRAPYLSGNTTNQIRLNDDKIFIINNLHTHPSHHLS